METKVLKKHTASICALTMKMEAAGTSKRLAAVTAWHLCLLPATSLSSLQTVPSRALQPTVIPFHSVTCSFFSCFTHSYDWPNHNMHKSILHSLAIKTSHEKFLSNSTNTCMFHNSYYYLHFFETLRIKMLLRHGSQNWGGEREFYNNGGIIHMLSYVSENSNIHQSETYGKTFAL